MKGIRFTSLSSSFLDPSPTPPFPTNYSFSSMPSPLPASSFLPVGGSCSLMRQETEINGGGPPQAACAITRKRVREARKTPELFFLPICFTWKGEQGKVQMISLLIMIISSSSMTENIHIRAGGKCRGHVHALPLHHCLPLWSSACTA